MRYDWCYRSEFRNRLKRQTVIVLLNARIVIAHRCALGIFLTDFQMVYIFNRLLLVVYGVGNIVVDHCVVVCGLCFFDDDELLSHSG
jgi:hypothetical protein